MPALRAVNFASPAAFLAASILPGALPASEVPFAGWLFEAGRPSLSLPSEVTSPSS